MVECLRKAVGKDPFFGERKPMLVTENSEIMKSQCNLVTVLMLQTCT